VVGTSASRMMCFTYLYKSSVTYGREIPNRVTGWPFSKRRVYSTRRSLIRFIVSLYYTYRVVQRAKGKLIYCGLIKPRISAGSFLEHLPTRNAAQ